MKYLIILKTYLSLAYKVFVVNKNHTNLLLDEIKQELRLNLDDALRQRIIFYTRQSFISASWACALRGRELSATEIRRVVCLGVITPLVDDLTDDLKLKSEEILVRLKTAPLSDEGSQWALARYLYDQMVLDAPSGFLQIFEEALASQDASLAQLEPDLLSEDQLAEISRKKGGAFVVLYRVVVDPPLQEGEWEALMTLGYLLQQVNDMFDVYKDSQNGQQTLFTNSNDLGRNYQDFQYHLNVLIEQFLALDFPVSKIKKCLLEISTVTSRGMVCLEQLMALQGTSQSFDLSRFSRKQLICDMEEVSNLISSFRYSARFYDQLKDRMEKQKQS